ncbi:MAG TPA: patatin-like protein [Stellaceae bacterium]|nr:patatin-like protein [Stellaceae bacterium]
MREKELRLALVCFGGVSLAIYMHGISKEILKLVRASSALHSIVDRGARAEASFLDKVDPADPEYDTETVYFDLLREIGRKVDLRVVVDIVAGASAGGINGTMLARAISHDLSFNALRDLWLENADVTGLLAPEARAHWWSKWYMRLFLWGAMAAGMMQRIEDKEARRKLSFFVRSRWFKAPFDGSRMAGLMYDAVLSMGSPRNSRASLLPSGQHLDLFVTVTDHYGYQQLIQIHDPPLIHEREHRHLLRFAYRRWPSGEIESDFDLVNAPALAFAARATSSFPGVFPAARVLEMDELVARRGSTWPRRESFIARNFDRYLRANIEPAEAAFVDGSVLNNKPFREAIQAIAGRPAYRQVDRRLVYIEPDPARAAAPLHHKPPGFFSMLKGALSDIPRNEPIADELVYVNGFNERVRRQKSIVEAARPEITTVVADAIGARLDGLLSVHEIRHWREAMNARAASDAGFAYEGYVRLKLASVRAFIAQSIMALRGVHVGSPFARAIAEILEAWAVEAGCVYRRNGGPAEAGAQPPWLALLLAFDVAFRKRRLHFLIQGQNRLYRLLDHEEYAGLSPAVVDRLKRDFYHCLGELRKREQPEFFKPSTRDLAHEIFATGPTAAEARDIEAYAREFARKHGPAIRMLVDRLAEEIDLDASTDDVDRLLAEMASDAWPNTARREVMVNYLGFPFWDILTFSVTSWREAGEFDEVLVDRISPADVRTLRDFGTADGLKGTGMGHFAAFFSRAYRENDYLIGRLHGVDRVIDIVCDAAGAGATRRIDVLALKRRAFEIILDAEEKALPQSAELIARLRRSIAAMGAGGGGN